MLLPIFTSGLKGSQVVQRTQAVVMALLLSAWLSACSSTATKQANTSQQGEIQHNTSLEEGQQEDSQQENTATLIDSDEEVQTKSERIPAINLYLQQQAQQPVIITAQVVNDYQQAISLMQAKKWSQANNLLDQIIVEQPNLSGSYVNKAIIAKRQGKLMSAQVLLSKAIAVNSLNLYAHHLQGQVYRLQGEFDKAEQSYLAALAIWPDFVEVHASMAILLELYRGRLIDAYGYYRTYLLLKSDDEEVKHWQAGLAIKIKRAGLEIPVLQENKQQSVELKSADEVVLDGKATQTIKAAEAQTNV